MAITVRQDVNELTLALAYVANKLQSNLTPVSDGYFHRDLTQNTTMPLLVPGDLTLSTVTVSAANATNLATSVTLVNELFGVLNQHMLDAQAHLVADLTNLPSDGYAPVTPQLTSDGGLATAITLVNALKVRFNDHRTQSGVHVNNDTVNVVSTSDATDLTSLEALANAMKTAVNAHIADAPTEVPRLNVITT